MKYYGLLTELELEEIPKFPNRFPMFTIGSEQEIRRYNATMVKAAQLGFNMSKRKICFTLACKEGFTHEEIFNNVKNLPEITEKEYGLLSSIPHWNPMREALVVLEAYIELMESARARAEEMNLPEIVEKAFQEGRHKRDVKISV